MLVSNIWTKIIDQQVVKTFPNNQYRATLTLTGEQYKQGISTGGFGNQSRKSGKALRFEWQVLSHPFLVPVPMSICLDTSLWKC